MKHIFRTSPNFFPLINGFEFELCEGGSVSVVMSDEDAEQFLAVPGYDVAKDEQVPAHMKAEKQETAAQKKARLDEEKAAEKEAKAAAKRAETEKAAADKAAAQQAADEKAATEAAAAEKAKADKSGKAAPEGDEVF